MQDADALELQQYRDEFKRIDVNDKDSLKRWLIEHKHFTAAALAAIAQCQIRNIRQWRKSVGIPIKRGQNNPIKNPAPQVSLTLPPPGVRWTSREWLEEAYKITQNTRLIGRTVGINHKRVEKRLKDLQLYRRKPPHPCDNFEWLHLHYVQQARSAAECARIAGVNRNAMHNWLAKHGIIVHSLCQTNYAVRRNRPTRTPLWFKALAGKMKESPGVRSVSLQEWGMSVRYVSGVRELYGTADYADDRDDNKCRSFTLTADDAKFHKVPEVHRQYPGDGLTASPYDHFIINRSEWDQAGMMERRVAVHKFAAMQLAAYPGVLRYPDEAIDDCLAWYRAEGLRKYIKSGVFMLSGGLSYGPSRVWPLAFSYFDLSEDLKPIFGRPRKLVNIIETMFRHGRMPLTTESVMREACRFRGIRMNNPVGYRAMFEQLGVTARSTILDFSPGVGCKAVACALIGGTYVTHHEPFYGFDDAVDLGFADRIGLKHRYYQMGDKVDIAYIDNSLRSFDLSEVLDFYCKIAKRVVCFVANSRRAELERRYKPKAILGVRCMPHSTRIDHLFVW